MYLLVCLIDKYKPCSFSVQLNKNNWNCTECYISEWVFYIILGMNVMHRSDKLFIGRITSLAVPILEDWKKLRLRAWTEIFNGGNVSWPRIVGVGIGFCWVSRKIYYICRYYFYNTVSKLSRNNLGNLSMPSCELWAVLHFFSNCKWFEWKER